MESMLLPALRLTALSLLLSSLVPAPSALADAGKGAELFQKSKCPMCHGADGSASTPAGKKFGARDLRSPEVQKQADAELAAVIKNGKGKMPSFSKTIDDAGIADLVAFVRRFAAK